MIVRTAHGDVRARYLLLCANAYLGRLVPGLAAYIMPVGTYIIATAPLGRERAQALLPENYCVCDTNFALDYFRLSADHRLLFGGRVSYSTVAPMRLAASMRRRMLHTFPQLADVPVEHVWGGNIAISRDRLPHIGQLEPNVYFAQGFSGHGVALTGMAGKLIADAIAGREERFDVFARMPHRRFPGGRFLRVPLLALASLYARLRDYL